MSWKASNLVAEMSQATGNARLAAFVIAEAAGQEDAATFLAHDTIARRARCHRNTAAAAIKTLADLGELRVWSRAYKTPNGAVNVYQLVLDGLPCDSPPIGTDRPPDQGPGFAQDQGKGVCTNQGDGLHKAAGGLHNDGCAGTVNKEPSTEPSPNEQPPGDVRSDPRIPATVNRKRVTVAEAGIAVRVLDYWKRRTGVAVTGTDVARAIICRVREDDGTIVDEDHKRIIDVNLAAPWWEGRATPTVLYGNGKAWNAAKARTSGPRGRHPDQDPTGDRVRARDARRAAAAVEDAKQYEGNPDASF